MLQISSELICGFNPCKITTCTVDPEAKCVTDYRCNPIFINAAGQKISGCTGTVNRLLSLSIHSDPDVSFCISCMGEGTIS